MQAEITTHPWRFATEGFRIFGNLYYVGNTDVSCHLIDTGDGLILLDTAFPETVYLLTESIRKLGFDPADIKYIVHSHAHHDHMGGTRAMVELTGAKTFLGTDDVEIVREKHELTWALEYGVEFHVAFDVDVAVDDGDTISLGNTTIECLNIPGHTPGALALFFDVSDGETTLRAGLNGAPGLNTLTDEYLAKNNLSASRRDDYINSVQLMKKQHVDIRLGAHPGQNDTIGKGKNITADNNPFIDETSWLAFLGDLENNFNNSF